MDFLIRRFVWRSFWSSHAIGLIFLITIFSGCKNKFNQGHYSGTLTSSILASAKGQSSPSLLPVGIDIVSSDWSSGSIAIKDEAQKSLYQIKWRHLKRGTYELILPFFESKKVVLSKKGKCYLSEAPLRVDVCFSDREFVLNIFEPESNKYFKLIADPFQIPKPFEMEKAKQFKLSEALDLALMQNLENQMEYEKMTQALLKAKAAWLSLFPRLNIRAGSPLRYLPEVSNFALVTVSSALGDFLPVLLPSRWFRAYSSSALGEAERSAFRAMRANLATHVEGLAYILDQQVRIAAEYRKLTEMLSELRPKLFKHVEGKVLSEFHFNDFDRVSTEIALEQVRADHAVIAAKRAISQALGLKNPDGVIGVDAGEEGTLITAAVPLQQGEVLKLARERSFELEQIYHLIESAKYDQRSHWWLSLDPNGDQNYSLGLALPSLIQVDQSKVRHLELMRAQVDQDLAHRVYELVESFNGDVEIYSSTLKVFLETRNSVGRYMSAVAADGSFSPDVLVNKIQAHLHNLARLESVQTDFKISRSKLDRLLLRGSYERLLPKAALPAEPPKLETGKNARAL